MESAKELKIVALKKQIGKLTPMMEQYHDIKIKYRDLILFFRMGDFYEVFFEDAVITSKVLNIALTKRGKIAGEPVPMAGLPHHSASAYIDKITAAGLRVAICEQVEDPKLAQGIVKRAVTQIVSPALPYDLEKNKSTLHHFLASFTKNEDSYYLSIIDFTTGDFLGLKCPTQQELIDQIKLYNPKEFLLYFDQLENFEELSSVLKNQEVLTTYISKDFFEEKNTLHFLKSVIPLYKKDKILMDEPHFISSISALSYYLISTQTEEVILHIKPFRFLNNTNKLKVSYQTLNSLEIITNKSSNKSSLIHFIDKTKSSMGSRKLHELCLNPSMDLSEINKRHDLIEYFTSQEDQLVQLRTHLQELRDLDRIFAKHSTNKIQGFDLINLANAIDLYFDINKLFDFNEKLLPMSLSKTQSSKLKSFARQVSKAICSEPGSVLSKGNLILAGFNEKRDELKNIESSVVSKINKLQEKYRKKFGISTLRIKSNNIAGYYVEVPKSKSHLIGDALIMRQTLVNSQRFCSPELDKIQTKLENAEVELLKIDNEIFDSFTKKIQENLILFRKVSDYLSYIDVFQGLSWLVIQEDFTRPTFHENKKINLSEVWHPLVKKVLKSDFIPHNVTLDEENFLGLITGPNMAGKTTVMREVAIVQFLAQIGSFVPAQKAEVPICDYIFSRIGANDDIVGGQSTFMLEMSETSEILRHATDKSLVILDEIGRGTSTYDGLSIAWSLLEFFVQSIKSLTLFSTHYHELIDVVDDLAGAKNFTVKTINKNGEVRFLYEFIEGGATQSFGIHVAKLAGLPREVLHRAKFLLKNLEEQKSDNSQMDLFSLNDTEIKNQEQDELISFIEDININSLTPIQALNTLNEIVTRIH
mgnify:CR=1 FL=1